MQPGECASTSPASCPELAGRIDDGLRAGIDTGRYQFQPTGREPFTMLFLGSFRHTPNQVALKWFVRRRAAARAASVPGGSAGGGRVGPAAAP